MHSETRRGGGGRLPIAGLALIAAATGLQGVWLGAILLTRAAPDPRQVVLLIVYTFVVACVTLGLPSRAVEAIRQAGRRLLHRERLFLVSLGVVVAAGGAVYALSPNRSFTDEAEVVTVANVIAEDGFSVFFREYARFPWLGTRHPPLMILVYGFAGRIAGLDRYGLRLTNVLCAVAVALLTYRLGRTLHDRATGALAAVVLLATPYFARLSGVAMLDMPLACTFTLALLVATRLVRADDMAGRASRGLVLGGILGCGLLVKYAMALIYPILVVWAALHGRLRKVSGALGLAACLSVAMLAGWIMMAWHLGVLGRQLDQVAFLATYGARGRTSAPWVTESLLTRAPSAFGVYLLPVLALGLRQTLTSRTAADLSVLAAIVLVVGPVTLMAPDPRYFFPAFPLLALVMARGLSTLDAASRVRVVLLVCLHALGALALLWGWERQTLIFSR